MNFRRITIPIPKDSQTSLIRVGTIISEYNTGRIGIIIEIWDRVSVIFSDGRVMSYYSLADVRMTSKIIGFNPTYQNYKYLSHESTLAEFHTGYFKFQ